MFSQEGYFMAGHKSPKKAGGVGTDLKKRLTGKVTAGSVGALAGSMAGFKAVRLAELAEAGLTKGMAKLPEAAQVGVKVAAWPVEMWNKYALLPLEGKIIGKTLGAGVQHVNTWIVNLNNPTLDRMAARIADNPEIAIGAVLGATGALALRKKYGRWAIKKLAQGQAALMTVPYYGIYLGVKHRKKLKWVVAGFRKESGSGH